VNKVIIELLPHASGPATTYQLIAGLVQRGFQVAREDAGTLQRSSRTKLNINDPTLLSTRDPIPRRFHRRTPFWIKPRLTTMIEAHYGCRKASSSRRWIGGQGWRAGFQTSGRTMWNHAVGSTNGPTIGPRILRKHRDAWGESGRGVRLCMRLNSRGENDVARRRKGFPTCDRSRGCGSRLADTTDEGARSSLRHSRRSLREGDHGFHSRLSAVSGSRQQVPETFSNGAGPLGRTRDVSALSRITRETRRSAPRRDGDQRPGMQSTTSGPAAFRKQGFAAIGAREWFEIPCPKHHRCLFLQAERKGR